MRADSHRIFRRLEHYNIYGNDLLGKLDSLGKRYYYLTDHLGSVRVTVKDTVGSPVDSWSDYYPFGKEARGSSTPNEPKEQFTGKERDIETGLDYFGARYYNSEIGRWTSVDPLSGKYPTVSPYNYVLNNPINSYDPNGEDVKMIHRKANVDAGHIILQVVDHSTGQVMSTWSFGPKDGPTANMVLGLDVSGSQTTDINKYLEEYKDDLESETIETTAETDKTLIDEISTRKDKNEDYNLYDNNCGQTALDIMKKGSLDANSTSKLPSSIFEDFKKLKSDIDDKKKKEEEKKRQEEAKKKEAEREENRKEGNS